jgi:hypothetical protein
MADERIRKTSNSIEYGKLSIGSLVRRDYPHVE